MIEVEKKFHLSDQDKARLLQGAQFIDEETLTDKYYDTADYALTTNDQWLRARNGKFELKISLNKDIAWAADQYDELEDEQEIRKAINLPAKKSFLEDLPASGYSVFCTCTTTRTKYKKGDFTIDLDEVSYQGDFTYSLAEVELMVNEPSEMESAAERIIEFAKQHQIKIEPVGGKVHFYIKNRMPEHFKKLVELKILRNV